MDKEVAEDHCTCAMYNTYCTYTMCEGILLWVLVKVPDSKVPTQYSWDLIAQHPFKLGRMERLVATRVEPAELAPRKVPKKKSKRQ